MKITLLVAALLFVISTPVHSENTANNEVAEYQVKALFLYNFANFVEWPESAFETDTAQLRLCLYGNVPFGIFLDEVDGTLIGDRELSIKRTKSLEDIRNGCQILFVGDDKKVILPTFWNEIKYLYVLSIGEEKGFASNGGVINIMRTTDQVQFEVNISNAMANGLFISSDLLSLARKIRKNSQ
jgi:hypothetical protein